jgi:hypothetical protein
MFDDNVQDKCQLMVNKRAHIGMLDTDTNDKRNDKDRGVCTMQELRIFEQMILTRTRVISVQHSDFGVAH